MQFSLSSTVNWQLDAKHNRFDSNYQVKMLSPKIDQQKTGQGNLKCFARSRPPTIPFLWSPEFSVWWIGGIWTSNTPIQPSGRLLWHPDQIKSEVSSGISPIFPKSPFACSCWWQCYDTQYQTMFSVPQSLDFDGLNAAQGKLFFGAIWQPGCGCRCWFI